MPDFIAFVGGGRTRTRTLDPQIKSQLLPAKMVTSLAICLHITLILVAL
jgi:hypothetical protein